MHELGKTDREFRATTTSLPYETEKTNTAVTPHAQGEALQSKLVAKFGADLLVDGFDAIPKLIKRRCRQVGMTPTECFLMEIIWSYWYEASELPWPSVETLSRVMMKSTRQVQRYLVRLQEKGFLQIVPRYNAHHIQITNLYDFSPLFAKMGELALAEKEDQSATPSCSGQSRRSAAPRGKSGRVTSSTHAATASEPARVTSLPEMTDGGRVTSLAHGAVAHTTTGDESGRVTSLQECAEKCRVTSLADAPAAHNAPLFEQGRVTSLPGCIDGGG